MSRLVGCSHFPHLIAIFPYNVSATSLGGVLLLRHLKLCLVSLQSAAYKTPQLSLLYLGKNANALSCMHKHMSTWLSSAGQRRDKRKPSHTEQCPVSWTPVFTSLESHNMVHNLLCRHFIDRCLSVRRTKSLYCVLSAYYILQYYILQSLYY